MSELLHKALRYRWLIFWVLAASYILVYFHRLCPAVVAVDMMHDLQAGGAMLGLLGSAYFYPYAIMQLPAGLLSDSWGPRRTITLFFTLAFAGSLLLGLAPSLLWAIIGRTLVGLGVSMLFVPTMKVLAEWFRVREFATMTGILMAMGGVGTLAAATPLALISTMIGWRFSFVAVGIVTLLLAILVWLFVRDRPADLGWPSPSESSGPSPQNIGLWEGMKRVLTYPRFWPVAIWFFFDCGVFFSFGGLWGGPYLMQVYGLTKAQAGQILSMLAVGMIVGSPLLSFLSNRIFKGRKPVLIVSSFFLFCLTALLAFYTDELSHFGLYCICFGFGIFSSAIVVIGFTTTKELFPVQIAGTSTGLVNIFPFAGGAVFQPLLGYILESHGRVEDAFTLAGYKQAFLVLFVCGLIAFLASLCLQETLTKE
ncbi:MAG: MFS transporter [Desulfobacterales bacterium S7086C20]|nr:MAG: MFS transporter [Desulfobacterales bacterium S7086C20]